MLSTVFHKRDLSGSGCGTKAPDISPHHLSQFSLYQATNQYMYGEK
jgi:hypothetical protein